MMYAIVENGVVLRVEALDEYEAKENAVYIGDKPVGTGDTYVDGEFYREGRKVLGFYERLEVSQAEMADMQAALNNLGVYADE